MHRGCANLTGGGVNSPTPINSHVISCSIIADNIQRVTKLSRVLLSVLYIFYAFSIFFIFLQLLQFVRNNKRIRTLTDEQGESWWSRDRVVTSSPSRRRCTNPSCSSIALSRYQLRRVWFKTIAKDGEGTAVPCDGRHKCLEIHSNSLSTLATKVAENGNKSRCFRQHLLPFLVTICHRFGQLVAVFGDYSFGYNLSPFSATFVASVDRL